MFVMKELYFVEFKTLRHLQMLSEMVGNRSNLVSVVGFDTTSHKMSHIKEFYSILGLFHWRSHSQL